MKKSCVPSEGKQPILFHIRDSGAWTKNPSLKLLSFASFDKEIATAATSLFEDPTGQMADNRNVMNRLNYLANYEPECFEMFIINTDLNAFAPSFSTILEENSRPDICLHVFIVEKSFAHSANGEIKLDYTATCDEIQKTLAGSTTFLFSHYLMLKDKKEAPPLEYYFSISAQEILSRQAKERSKELALENKYGAAAIELAKALEKMRSPQCFTMLVKFTAKLMAEGGDLFAKRAKEEQEKTTVLLEQSISCYESAIFYCAKLKLLQHAASCYAKLAITRTRLLMTCAPTERENHRKLLVMEANTALLYYKAINNQAMCTSLQNLIAEYSDDQRTKKNTSVCEKILMNAEVVFNTYRTFPERVTMVSLVSTEVLLNRALAQLADNDRAMKKRCHKTLVKVHFTHAMCTKNYDSAQDHLSEALKNLPLAELGTTAQEQDLLEAASHHMRGRVLLQYKSQKSHALRSLEKAFVIYQKHNKQEGMAAITRIAPSITVDDDYSPTKLSGPK